MRILIFLIVMLINFSFLFAQNNAPQVINVSFLQRTDGSFIVDVYYDLVDADSNGVSVTMDVSDDNGATWNFTCANTSGDIGEYISSGTGKHIIWDFGTEHPETFGDQFRVKITADDEPLTDVDGNTYHIVKIGNQWWMAENLKVTHYSNGDSIPEATDNVIWANLTIGAWCNYNNDSTNGAIYGKMYNWYAVDDSRNVAPAGWHVPTDDEWKELEMYLGMSQAQANNEGWRGTDEGGKLKEAGTAHWNSPNTAATNSSGFTALPGGWRWHDNGFWSMGYDGYWWSSTEYNVPYAWYRFLDYFYSQVYRTNIDKYSGFNIRCVRD